MSLLEDLLVALDMVAHGEVRPVFKPDTALGVLAHLCHVLFDVLQRAYHAWEQKEKQISIILPIRAQHICKIVLDLPS